MSFISWVPFSLLLVVKPTKLLLSPTSIGWHTWRGPLVTGAAPKATPPTTWSEEKNVRWKVEIPGRGHSTPVAWGEMLYLTTAIAEPPDSSQQQVESAPPQRPRNRDGDRPRRRRRRRGPTPTMTQFVVMAINKNTGKTVWQKTAAELVPHEGTHPDGTWASNSVAVDDKHVYVSFGSRGIYCFDHAGNQKWQIDLGDMRTRNGFGEGSSPAVWGNTLIVNWDHEDASFIVALEASSGKEIWRKSRDEVTSWSTPVIVQVGSKAHAIVAATTSTRAYDISNGDVVWECPGMTTNTIPSPVVRGNVVYVMSGFRGSKLQAIDYTKAKGEVNADNGLLWEYDSDTPYVPSPVLSGNRLYFLKGNRGILSCIDIDMGKPLFGPQRLEGVQGVYASPVAANGHIYLVGRDGTTQVIRDSDTFEIVATNKLEEGFDASPIAIGDALYLRGKNHLYCLAK